MADTIRTGDRQAVAVIGLGRFGVSVARSLLQLGHEVLAVDSDPALTQRLADEFTHIAVADSTDEDALQQLGLGGFSRAVVGMGTRLEASVLTVLVLTQLGVEEIWAKAISRKHGQILQRVGAAHVVYPETAMGEKVAHMVSGAMTDYIEFDDGFAIARTRAPEEAHDKTLADSALRAKHHVTVVGVKRAGQDFTYAVPETTVHRHDELIVSGATASVEKFCGLTSEAT
ncbi:MAG: potassium channel family protein [Nocardioidaceae bacterium]